jgi:hypothetical protein
MNVAKSVASMASANKILPPTAKPAPPPPVTPPQTPLTTAISEPNTFVDLELKDIDTALHVAGLVASDGQIQTILRYLSLQLKQKAASYNGVLNASSDFVFSLPVSALASQTSPQETMPSTPSEAPPPPPSYHPNDDMSQPIPPALLYVSQPEQSARANAVASLRAKKMADAEARSNSKVPSSTPAASSATTPPPRRDADDLAAAFLLDGY